jgi:hypothetical protein
MTILVADCKKETHNHYGRLPVDTNALPPGREQIRFFAPAP